LFCPPCGPTNGTAVVGEGDGDDDGVTTGVATSLGMGIIDDPLTVIPPGVVPVGDGAVTALEPLTTNPFGAFVGMGVGGTLGVAPFMRAVATAGSTVLVNESELDGPPVLFPPLTTI